MHTDYISKILRNLYEHIENKEIFIPIVIANTIICYKLTFYDKSYWMEFSHWVLHSGIKLQNFEDIEIFFTGFVKQTPQFELLYNDTLSRLKSYTIFFQDFSIKQKYYYKNPEKIKQHMQLYWNKDTKAELIHLCQEILKIAWDIKFKKN